MKPAFLALLLLSSLCASTRAQDYGPPAEVKQLSWLLGKWSGTGEMSGGKVKFTVDTKMIIGYDGQFIRTESTDTANGFTLTKTELTGWDQKLGKYSSYAFTNIAPLPRTSHGDFKDDRFISVSEPWSAEEMSSVTRQTLIKISDTKIRLILELSTGKYWATEMDVTLTKSPD